MGGSIQQGVSAEAAHRDIDLEGGHVARLRGAQAQTRHGRREGMRTLVALWGVGGVVLLLVQALWRLTPIAVTALRTELAPLHFVFLVGWVAFMVHAEGYRGFHRRFSPRVVARARHLAEHRRPLSVALAPLFCMSLFGASRRGVWVARCVFAGVFGLVIVVRALPQPWRGLVDAGVIAGLGVGLGSLLYYTGVALRGGKLPVGPDLPEDDAKPALLSGL